MKKLSFSGLSLILLIIVIGFPGCGGQKSSLKQEPERKLTEAELQKKRQELEQKNVEILDLKSALTIQQAELEEMKQERERLIAELERLKKEKALSDSTNQLLLDSLNQQKANLDSLLKAFDEERRLSEEIVRSIETKKDSVVRDKPIMKPDTVIITVPYEPTLSDQEYRTRYNQALDHYWQREYQKAIQEFHNLIELWPGNSLADNAQYWAGECYYSMGEYNRAIEEFKKVFTFEESNKYDAALLKIGLCYLRLGDRETALRYFQQLEKEYPDSELIDKAHQFLKGEF